MTSTEIKDLSDKYNILWYKFYVINTDNNKSFAYDKNCFMKMYFYLVFDSFATMPISVTGVL